MSKVSYKIYQNDSLKKVRFHGKDIAPLYIQVVYLRFPDKFKSYFFDLLTHPKYSLKSSTNSRFPTIKHIKDREARVIEFIINKLGDNFTLSQFKTYYRRYANDLLSHFENHFNDTLKTFLLNHDMPNLSEAIYRGSRELLPFEVVYDLKSVLPPALFGDLISTSLKCDPYLPIYAFAKTRNNWPVLFPVMDWYTNNVQQDFRNFVKMNYPDANADELIKIIENSIQAL